MPDADLTTGRETRVSTQISKDVARRFLVLRHFLTPPRALPAQPDSVMTVIDRIGALQYDPLEIAGRNHDLVLLARIDGYRREWTDALLYEERRLFEAYNKMLSILPTAELPYYRIAWDRARVRHDGGAFDEHAPLVEELLERIRTNGRLSSRDVEPRAAIDWYWRPTNQVRAILEALAEAGVLGIARRERNQRVYDLVERLFPAELLAERPRPRDQYRHKLLSRYRGHGLLRATGLVETFIGTYPEAALGIE
ncbi:MAG: winged helix DNA-binding domain-containing protein, partial [Chloroflexota bacterium]|nr:winged helix DNA-binding domain-containing protein [Chloroflexota bacterium]